MKKFAKMSLVAALAVAGTAASAQPLAEAIKNVDVSGTVVYRYNDTKSENFNQEGALTSDDENADSATNNYYKIGVSLKSKVTDDVAFNSRILVDNAWGLSTNEDADSQVAVELSQANFAYTGVANTTVIVGKQGLQTPWTNAIDSDGSEQTGTGILALSTFGPVTVAGGYINQHNVTSAQASHAFGNLNGVMGAADDANDNAGSGRPFSAAGGDNLSDLGLDNDYVGSKNLMVAGLLGTFGPVNTQAWYLDHQDTFKSYFLKADAKFDLGAVKLGTFAQYTRSKLDGDIEDAVNGHVENATGNTVDDFTDNKYSLLKIGVNAKMGIFSAAVTYGKTGEDGSGVLNSLAQNGMIGYNVNLGSTSDARMWQFDVAAQVTEKLNLALNYDKIKDKSTDDYGLEDFDNQKEIYLQATYNVSKNLSAYVRLADGEKYQLTEDGEVDYKAGRLQVQYSF